MRKILALAALTAALPFAANATPIRLDGRETNLQQIMDDFTAGGERIDVVTDQYVWDQAWTASSSGPAGALILLELAGYAGSNKFGLYDIANPTNRVQLFNGAAGTGSGARFAIDGSGQVLRNGSFTGQTFAASQFGFYLDTPVGLWHSQQHLNSDDADHLVAYSVGPSAILGSDVFMFGWEDLASRSWDQDYNDLVVLVGGIKGVSVPEPTTLSLLGLGLLGITAARRRVATAA